MDDNRTMNHHDQDLKFFTLCIWHDTQRWQRLLYLELINQEHSFADRVRDQMKETWCTIRKMEWETYINTGHNTCNCQAHLPSGNHLLFHSFTFFSSFGVVTTCSSFRGHTFCFLFVFYASYCDLDSAVCEILFPSFKAYLAKPLVFFFFTLSCCFFFLMLKLPQSCTVLCGMYTSSPMGLTVSTLCFCLH